MKKYLLVLVIALSVCMQNYAQKGMHGIGLNFATNVVDALAVGVTAKYQYNISNYIRLEPSFSYHSVQKGEDGFDMIGVLNGHLFFMPPRSFRPYVFAGVGFVNYVNYHYYDNYSGNNYKKDEEGFGFDAGAGIDYRVSHKVSLQLEAGVVEGLGIHDAIGGRFNLGFCYNF